MMQTTMQTTFVVVLISAAWLAQAQEAKDGPAVGESAGQMPPQTAPGERARSPRTLAPTSLYNEASYQSLTSDRRLYRVGDLVTVQIAEASSASTSAGTGANRDASIGVTASTTSRHKQLALGTTNDFNGQGSTQRAGRVLGQLTVAIREIAANQDLLISGEQVLEINGEKQMIRLEGRVRAKDINELNVVLSSRVAEARISIVGDGAIAERQKPSWWQQLLTFFGV
jgi:flagellar L-ring protein precursor FlgH